MVASNRHGLTPVAVDIYGRAFSRPGTLRASLERESPFPTPVRAGWHETVARQGRETLQGPAKVPTHDRITTDLPTSHS